MIAPTLHCSYKRATEDTKVGERSMGDARLDYDAMTYGWFDHFLKGEDNHILETMPKVKYFVMGANKWETSDTWPPKGATPKTFYLSSAGKANTLKGDGALAGGPPNVDKADAFIYDPREPVSSYGGNVCCTGNAVQGGALDQRKMEERPDILVYTTEPFKEGTEVSGPIDVTLYVSSDAKDTDFTVKIIDVAPDGPAYNLDETIQRVPLSQRLRQADRAHGKRQGVQSHAAADDHQQLFPGRPQHPDRSVEQQFPALRPQPEHRRQQLRRDGREWWRTTKCTIRGSILRR